MKKLKEQKNGNKRNGENIGNNEKVKEVDDVEGE